LLKTFPHLDTNFVSVNALTIFYTDIVGLCYRAATLYLHLLENIYSNELMDETSFWLAVEEHPVSMFSFNGLL
jgi:hypothetical protein